MRYIYILLLVVAFAASAKLPTVSSGTLQRISEFSSQFVPARNIDIWLPPGYTAEKTYPVIYMHDGQMLFDASITWNNQAWEADDTAARLIESGQIPPVIIVGIWNGGVNRHSEYFPQQPFNALPQDKQQMLYNEEGHGTNKLFSKPVYSDDYLRFLVQELKPFIEQRYPVRPDASFLMGSSMGGLVSWYGLMEYPEEFAGAACLSTHWPGDFSNTNNPIPEQFEAYIRKNINKLTNAQKLYFDYGTATLDAWYPPLQLRVDQVIKASGYPANLWVSRMFEGAAHTESAWAERLEFPLLFLLADERQVYK